MQPISIAEFVYNERSSMERPAGLSNRDVRQQLDTDLPSVDDVLAFILDEFGQQEYQRLEGMRTRVQLVNEFLILHSDELERIVVALDERRKKRVVLLARPRLSVALWGMVLAGVALLIAVGLSLFIVLRRDGAQIPPPQIIIVPMAAQAGDEAALLSLRQLPFDTPEQFSEKVRAAGPNRVRYQVAQDRSPDTNELLRLVVALLKETNQRVSAMKYRQSQRSDWQHSTQPRERFLAQLISQIETHLAASEPILAEQQRLVDLASPTAIQELANRERSQAAALPVEQTKGKTFIIEQSQLTLAEVDVVKALDAADVDRARLQLGKLEKLCRRGKGSLRGACFGSLLQLFYRLGIVLERQQKFESAMECFRKALDAYAPELTTSNTVNRDTVRDLEAAVKRMTELLGQVIVVKKTKQGCQEEILWMEPGLHRLSIGTESAMVTVKRKEVIHFGHCP